MKELILANASPRRKELLSKLDIPFEIDAADADESTEITDPALLVEELSARKAAAVAKRHPDAVVIGADTVVAADGVILGKPADDAEALSMLKSLSGKTHQVYTGVTLIRFTDGEAPKQKTFHVRTDVTMYDNDEETLKRYVKTKEPSDKAGAYGIQGRGGLLVKEIAGDYYNVVGLPVARLARELSEFLRNLDQEKSI